MTKEDRSSDPYGHPFVKLLDVKGKAFRIYVSDDGEFLTYVNRATGNAAGKREPNDHGFSEERINAVSIDEHKIQVAREKIEEEWKIDVRKVAQEAIEQVVGSA